MATVNLDVSPYEVTGVYTHPDAKVDIVLVHGLNGDPKRTWTSKDTKIFWPAELLPRTLGLPPANILVYGYNANVHGGATDNPIMNHAQTLVTHLTYHRQRQGTTRNPIIWIAHSLGGILTKRALLYSKDVQNANRESFRSIYVSTFAIIFLGTPHNGSNLASIGLSLQTLGSRFLPKAIFESEPILLRTLQRDSEILREINNQFLDIYQQFKIHMVHENLKTDLKVTKALIVSAESASPQLANVMYYGIEATHSGMCKFGSDTAPGYRTITGALREWIRDGPSVIQGRWNVEDKERNQHRLNEMEEARALAVSLGMGQLPGPGETTRIAGTTTTVQEHTHASDVKTVSTQTATVSSGTVVSATPTVLDTGDVVSSPSLIPSTKETRSSLHLSLPAHATDTATDTSTDSLDSFYFAPEKFRPNSYFVGRDAELAELHTLLQDPKRASEGSSAVVIHSLHGGGKTHLAREYFFKHRHDYPGGVCWVRAKSIHEMEQFYWNIAMTRPLREFASKIREANKASSGAEADMDDLKRTVDNVCKWFNSRDRWLLVFDAILFNTPGIERFVPDTKNTSIIFTSTQNTASGNYRFDNPRVLKLGMLRPEHAQELLFKELERTNPSSEDQRLALDLVKHLGCLPLMVHISARHIKKTQEPLSKYLRTLRDRSRIKPSELSAYIAVCEELKTRQATPALNLMYILAYFDSRTPVGLLNLGLQALDKTVAATLDESNKTRSLTNTLKTLIAFALLERTEADSVSPTSSRSSTRRGIKRSSTSVDVLLVHTVVQLFFVGVLHEEKQSEFWMERSATVYCHAFDEAHDLITRTPQVGILDDYRCFKIHGHKLLEHLTARMDKKSSSHSVLAEPVRRIQKRLEQCDDAILRISKDAHKHFATDAQSMEPLEIDYTVISVFERTNSISDSEDSSHASVATPTGSVDTPPLSSAFSRRRASRTATIFDGERVGVNVRDDEDLWRYLNSTDGFGSPGGEDAYRSPGPASSPQHAQHMEKGKQPMTGPLFDAHDDMEGSTIFYQSPELADTATVPGLQRPYPEGYRASGASASYFPRSPQLTDDDEDTDTATDTATAHAPTPHPPNLSPAETEVYKPRSEAPTSHPNLRGQYSPLAESHHRTVRKYNGRRYHDSAGAWRQMGSGDPRVTVDVDYGTAKGSVVRPHSRTSETLEPDTMSRTEAETALRALSSLSLRAAHNAAAVSSAVEEAPGEAAPGNQSKSRAQSTGTMGVRPLMAIHDSSLGLGISDSQYTGGDPSASPKHASPPVDIQQAKTRSDSSASFLSNSLRRLRELVSSSHSESSNSQPRRDNPAPRMRASSSSYAGDGNGPSDSIQDLIDAHPVSYIGESRTTRSSPSQAHDSFSRPPYPILDTMPHFENRHRPEPAGGYVYDRSHSDLPSSIRDWASQPFHPGNSDLMPSVPGFGLVSDNHMAESYPTPGPSSSPRPFMLQSPTLAATQYSQRQFLVPGQNAEGYSSQPMSRDQSSQSRQIPQRLSSVHTAAGDLQARLGPIDRRHIRNTSSMSSGSRSRPINAQPGLRRDSRSSLVETEPSPPTHNPFDVHTSYQWFEEKRQRGPVVHRFVREDFNMQQQDAASRSQVAFQSRLQAIEQGAAMQASASRTGRGHGNGNGNGHGNRSGSGSGSSSTAMSRSHSDFGTAPRPRRGSESIPAAGAWASRSMLPPPHQYPTHMSTVGGAEYTSEPMSRGGSGSAQSRPGAAQFLPRGGMVDAAGYSSEPMSRNPSGGGRGSAQSRAGANASRTGRVLQDFGSGQPGEQ